MGRRGKPAKGKVNAKRPLARKVPKNDDTRVRDLEKRLAESLEREKAAGEILRVISSSPTDLQPVLDAMAESATRLCASYDANIFRLDGDVLRLVAHHGPLVVPLGHVVSATRGSVAGRAVLDRQTVQAADLQTEADEFPDSSPTAQKLGYRTTLGVPLLREGKAIGAISLRRTQVQPFTDKQIALLQTFADQAVIAIEHVRLFTELQERNRALTQAHGQVTEALEQQTATAEILRVIASSPTEYQPVFDTIVRTAGVVCGAVDAMLWTIDGDELIVRAHHGPLAAAIGARQPVLGSVAGYAVRQARVVHVEDLTEADDFPVGRDLARRLGWRTTLSAPLLREGVAIGAILIRRSERRRFSDQQIALLQTFADQAVIAIENVRLFTELEARNRDLADALERQTATSEILRVISSSPTDTQPIFDAIAQNAVALCGGIAALVLRFDGEMLHVAGHHAMSPEGVERNERAFPRRPGRDYPPGRAFLDRKVVHVPDLQATTEFAASTARQRGAGSQLAVPLLHEGEAIGVIGLARDAVGAFSPQQIEMLKTFADQAVIAIENVRLFTELDARNRELTEALDQQTATSEILKIISSSPTDVQPVFDTIVRSAVRLCKGFFGVVLRYDGDVVSIAAEHNFRGKGLEALRSLYPGPINPDSLPGRALLSRSVVHVHDQGTDIDLPVGALIARAAGFRTGISVPMLRESQPIGTINVARRERQPFSQAEIDLLKTFADQAVIAIENARLLGELRARTSELTRSVEELTALGEVSRALSSTLDLETVLQTIVNRAVQLSYGDAGTILEYDQATEEFQLRVSTEGEEAVAALRGTGLRRGEGAVGRMAVTREPVQIPDIAVTGAYESRVRDALLQSGRRAVLALPLQRDEHLIGGLVISRNIAGGFPIDVIELLKTFATQSTLAIQNARLFREIEENSRELEAASRHKSEFLANMSHELRTPLNAVIGFSEVLADGLFGEVNEKQTEYLNDILESGRHLLSLINDILDLSKIEAGRMELEATDFDLPSAIENALTLVRERASRRGIALGRTIDERLAIIRADERKVKQVLLNLLSNALKFTPEGGRIDVRAGVQDGVAEISVTDTGVGIAPDDQQAVFEEFRQVGTAAKKVEGTGLGLALSRKFIELHGGRIWVKSQVGEGSTFTFTLPVSR